MGRQLVEPRLNEGWASNISGGGLKTDELPSVLSSEACEGEEGEKEEGRRW